MSSFGRKVKKRNSPVGGVFKHGGFIYSISERNKYDEYLVMKLDDTSGEVKILDTRLIKAKTLKELQMNISKYPFDMFKKYSVNNED